MSHPVSRIEPLTFHPGGAERLRLYAYASAPEAASYVAIMRLFVGALVAEWSAHDLVERGIDMPVDVVEQRLRYDEQNGNLLASPREVRVTSIAEFSASQRDTRPRAGSCSSTRRPTPARW